MLTLNYHQDPAHGWVEVEPWMLDMVNMPRSSVTRYSYKHGDKLYLEEDCDFSTFADHAAKAGVEFNLRGIYYCGDAPMRFMDRV